MIVEGTYTFKTQKENVWKMLTDPQILEKCTPGCQELIVLEEDIYEMILKIGIAAISGTYKGRMELCDKEPTDKYKMIVSGSGPIGTIEVIGEVWLKGNSEETQVSYKFDAKIGGVMAGLGQRALVPIAKLLIKQFFNDISKEISKAA